MFNSKKNIDEIEIKQAGGTNDEINLKLQRIFKYDYEKKYNFVDIDGYNWKRFEVVHEGNHQLWDKPMCSISFTKDFLSTKLADDLKKFFKDEKNVNNISWEPEGDGKRVSYWGDVDYVYGHHKKYIKHKSNSAKNRNVWHPILLTLLKYVNKETGYEYNSILSNDYVDGSVGLTHHKDDEKTLDKNSPVLTISLGAVRNLNFMGVSGGAQKLTYDINMPHNSAVFMLDNTNQHFKHGIVHSNTKYRRFSITLRKNEKGTLPYQKNYKDTLNYDEAKNISKRKVSVYYSDGTTNLKKIYDKFENNTKINKDWNN